MSSEEKARKKSEKAKTRLKLSDFLVPAVSGLIFLLVLFFILIPSIENSSEMLLEIDRVEKDQGILRKNVDMLSGIDFTELQKDLSNSRKVLPRRLEVAQFAYYVDSLAEEKKLQFRELKAGDIAISTEESSALDVKGIRVPMAYRGDYEPILDFFDELQLVSPYVISFGHKVELNKSFFGDDEKAQWSLEIDVTGYYVEEDETSSERLNLLVPVRPYVAYEETIKEFQERSEKLSQ